MLLALLLIIAACIVFGVFTTAKWLLIVAAVLFVYAVVTGRSRL